MQSWNRNILMAMAGTRWLRVTGVTGAHSPQCNEKTHLPVAQTRKKSKRNIDSEKKKEYHIPPNTIGKLQHLERRTYNERLYFSAAFSINLNNRFGFESFDQAMD